MYTIKKIKYIKDAKANLIECYKNTDDADVICLAKQLVERAKLSLQTEEEN